jgi:hypothetical protein
VVFGVGVGVEKRLRDGWRWGGEEEKRRRGERARRRAAPVMI